MKPIRYCLLIALLCLVSFVKADEGQKYPGHWIATPETEADSLSSWTAFRKDIAFNRKPKKAEAIIAADTKYWLWINGQLAVFEGGLKRGPSPKGTYYDRVDLAPYLVKGENRIAVLLWHFGKDGFSHVDSGRSGLFFSLKANGEYVVSDSTWLSRLHPAYGVCGEPYPNFRLPESNIRFDARRDIAGWQEAVCSSLKDFKPAKAFASWGTPIYGKMVERPIPQWKDFGIRAGKIEKEVTEEGFNYTVRLPYNMQMTPIIKVYDTEGGHTIGIRTDHSVAGGEPNIRAEYITRSGTHTYESLGWMNGEQIIITAPKEVELLEVAYRETGYDTEFTGRFSCNDSFYNRFWEKVNRTLYVNMRDTYFDCPDRERAQWYGDFVLLMDECFCTTSSSTQYLMRKAIREFVDWQKPDSVLYGPVPGVWTNELPAQSLATIGRYGVWNYYMNTGDRQLIEYVYPAIRCYLSLWKVDFQGLTVLREGGWLWGDWGTDKDMRLLMAGWHYLALEGAAHMADLLGRQAEADGYRTMMERVKAGFNACWNGYAYRHPSYQGATDDRVQALAVLSEIAGKDKYSKLFQLFKTQQYASPYMEKYVMEALFTMGKGSFALERTKQRFGEMVNDTLRTTLYEGWGIGEKGFGGGTTNHAWSGGAQIVIARRLFGIRPLEPAYKTFLVEPQPTSFTKANIAMPTPHGEITISFTNGKQGYVMQLTVPKGTVAVVRLPKDKGLKVNGRDVDARNGTDACWQAEGYTAVTLKPGQYTVSTDREM